MKPIWLACILLSATLTAAQDQASRERSVITAFAHSCDGYSSDEVLLDDKRRALYLATVREHWPDADEGEACAMLLKLRKAGKLNVKATRRGQRADPLVLPVAEIAIRTVMEKHDASSDAILIDPLIRRAFDRAARQVIPDVSLYQVRKAALQLRKSRRLKPELVLRVADWDKEIEVHQVSDLRRDLGRIPLLPGIYIFRDRTGYLYIGEAINLRTRLTQHLKESDRQGLAFYLSETGGSGLSVEWHAFAKDSPAKTVAVRRAYESELIRSRKPRFNIRP